VPEGERTRLEIRVLGPVEIAWDGRPVDIGGVKARALVARLDRSLVDGTLFHLNHITLPAVDAQIRGNGNALQAAIGKLGVTAAKLGDTADGVTAVTNSLNVRINDPVIDSTLRAFNLAAENLSTTTANMSVVTGTGGT